MREGGTGTATREAWQSIPIQGPIAEVLRRRQEWLTAIARGEPGARLTALQDLADDGRTEDRIRQGYTGRAGIELLQNAHDAMAEAGLAGDVRFVVTPTALLVSNEGAPFDAARVASITRLGSSDKAAGRGSHHQIGYKGIGFTSVFEVSDRPQVLSRDVGFKFDRAGAAALVRDRLGELPDGPLPARYFPLPIEAGDLDDDRSAVVALFRAGAATVIRLPFRADVDRAVVLTSLRASLAPEMLLFMPTIRTLSLEDGVSSTSWTQRTASRIGDGGIGRLVHIDSIGGERVSWLLATSTVPVGREKIDALNDPLWSGISSLNVGAAIPWSGRGPRVGPPPARLHSYFPTDDELGRAIVLHADFNLDSTRQRILTRGAGGDVSRIAADGVADLAARLVASTATWGAAVLASCTLQARPDGAGDLIGKRLEAALARHPVARRFRGGAARPGDLVRLGLDLPTASTRRLASVLDPATDLLMPDDDRGDVRTLLRDLGAIRLEPVEVAERIDMRKSKDGYAAGLALLGEWVATTAWLRDQVVGVLADRRVVQDEAGEWVRPNDVERRTASAPDLPDVLRRDLVMEPSTDAARKFLDLLGIARLNARTALTRLLDALEADAFGRDDRERAEALDLAFRIWKAAPAAFDDERERLTRIEVPCRTAAGREPVEVWQHADQAYFGRDWLGEPVLEELYGRFDEAEFVSEPPPPKPTDRDRRRAFFRDLGVESAPAKCGVSWSAHYPAWRAEVGGDAWTCDLGHSRAFSVSGWKIDRLDEILEVIDEPGVGAALARALATLPEPYGPPSVVQCTASQHRGRAPERQVMGYQRWRLTGTPWIPVTGDPGGAALQVPANAWRSLQRGSRLMVPRARVPAEVADRLDLVSAERPPLEAIEHALASLADAFPDLDRAPAEVNDTATWLLLRLERAVVRGERPQRTAPPLPALGAAGLVWSRRPVVANLPGMPRLPTLEVLPPGRWPGVARTYHLRGARDQVEMRVVAGPQRVTDFVLPHAIRGHLLALLLRRGADPDRTAARLSLLVERPVASLRVLWSHGSAVVEDEQSTFALEPRRDAARRLIGAQLVRLAGWTPDFIALGAALADYLDLPGEEGEIGLFLTAPARVPEQRGLTAGEVEEADRLLRRRRGYEEQQERDAAALLVSAAPELVDDRLNMDDWTPPDPSPTGAGGDPEPETKGYPDLSSARVGPARRIERSASGTRSSGAVPARPGDPARRAARTLPTPGSAERRATASGRKTEVAAINLVKRIGDGLPEVTEVIDVQDLNRGWDLEFRMADGSFIPVEVKGSSGSASFMITANEWAAAKRHPNYVLYHVVDITSPGRIRVRLFRNLGTRLGEDLVSSAGWAVTGWRELEFEEMDVEV